MGLERIVLIIYNNLYVVTVATCTAWLVVRQGLATSITKYASTRILDTLLSHDRSSPVSRFRGFVVRKLLFLLLLPALATSAFAKSAPLVTPAELQSLIGQPDIRVVDIREGKTEQGQTLYDAGHVPGAVSAPYSRWRGAKDNPGALPALDKLTETIRSAGLAPDTRVVIVSTGADASDFGAAARVYWTLKVAGLHDLSILNGGYKAWAEAKLPTSSETTKVAASQYTPVIDTSLIATREQVAALDTSKVQLVDARPKAFFDGETRHAGARIPGTLAGAKNLSHASWFRTGSGTFVAPEEAQRIASQAGLDGDADTVSFCNTGHWAATNWFALSEVLGEKNVRMYPESMVEWSKSDLPMANVPNRAQQLAIDARFWWQRTFN